MIMIKFDWETRFGSSAKKGLLASLKIKLTTRFRQSTYGIAGALPR